MEERFAWQVGDTNCFTAPHSPASGKRPPQPGPEKPRVEHARLHPEGVEIRHLGEQPVSGARVVGQGRPGVSGPMGHASGPRRA